MIQNPLKLLLQPEKTRANAKSYQLFCRYSTATGITINDIISMNAVSFGIENWWFFASPYFSH